MRLAVCCKEDLLRDALASLLNHEGGFHVVAKSEDLKNCITLAKEVGAQVLVVYSEGLQKQDLTFLSGAKAFGNIGTILLLAEGDKGYGPELFDREIPFRSTSETIFEALRELRIQGKVPNSVTVRESRGSYGELTRREYEVAQLVGKGFSNRKIAEATGLREQSIKNLVSVIMRKLKCENRVQVALRLTTEKAPQKSGAL